MEWITKLFICLKRNISAWQIYIDIYSQNRSNPNKIPSHNINSTRKVHFYTLNASNCQGQQKKSDFSIQNRQKQESTRVIFVSRNNTNLCRVWIISVNCAFQTCLVSTLMPAYTRFFVRTNWICMAFFLVKNVDSRCWAINIDAEVIGRRYFVYNCM